MDRLNRVFIFILGLTLVGCGSPAPSPPAGGGLQPHSPQRRIILSHAIDSIGTPYAWGGTTPAKGFDCSGLVVYTHTRAGISTPRTAKALFHKSRAVPVHDLRPGDLVFFKRAADKQGNFHVGIYIGQKVFVHAPGQGRRVGKAALDNPYFKQNFIGAGSFL